MMRYLTKYNHTDVLIQQHSKFYLYYFVALNQISNGASVWDEHMCDETRDFKRCACNNWMNVPLNTQIYERWVKDSQKLSLVNGKSEKYYCQLTMCRCTTVMEFKNIAMDRVKSEIMKENKNYTSGIIGERVNKLTGDLDEYKKLTLIEGRLFLQVV